jgi:hypothetical protein
LVSRESAFPRPGKFEEEGKYLCRGVQNWLNKEYIPDKSHLEIGSKVSSIYTHARLSGVDDLKLVFEQINSELHQSNFKKHYLNVDSLAEFTYKCLVSLTEVHGLAKLEPSSSTSGTTELSCLTSVNVTTQQLNLLSERDFNDFVFDLNNEFKRVNALRNFLTCKGKFELKLFSSLLTLDLASH